MSRIGFQEKMLWAQLGGIVAVVGFYARFLAHSGPGHHYFHVVLIILLFLFASLRTFVHRCSSNVVEDERDRAIASIGTHWSNLILWLGLVIVFVMYWDHGSMRSANFLIGILFHLAILAGSVRILSELVAYRKSA